MDPCLQLESLSRHFRGVLDLGVALEPEELDLHGDVVAHHFSRLTAENAMKFGELSRIEGHYRWERADAIANFARRHGMRMTGHTLLWHRMQPEWLFTFAHQNDSREVLGRRLREHVFCVVERYADVVDNWDVVNEAVSDRMGELWRGASESSAWYGTFGNADFVELAFRYAAEATDRYCPNAKLYYNDYDLEKPEKRDKAICVLRHLRSRGIRVDGVGLQGHVQLVWPSALEFGRAIDEFAAEALAVKISELDVSVYAEDVHDAKTHQPPTEYGSELEATLADRYVELFKLFVSRAQTLTSVVLWGVSDDRSWLNSFPIRRPNYPLLFDHAHLPKLALRRLLEI